MIDPGVARTRLYRDGKLALENFPVDRISEELADPAAVVWLDLRRPTTEQLELCGEEFGLHELAIEDAVDTGQRPKLDRYDSHLFISAYWAKLDPERGTLATSEIAVFVLKRALVTVRKSDDFDIDEVVRHWDRGVELAPEGVAYLLYGLLDVLVDSHFAAVESLDDSIEDVGNLLFDQRRTATEEVQRHSFELRKSLVQARRVVLPMREVVNALMRPDLHVVGPRMMPYYQDVYDHVLRAAEWTESLRDLVTSILESNLTLQSNRMNLIMKKVTSWAAIIAVPTAITGYYGQNLPYPGFGTTWGFVVSCALIVGIGTVLYFCFKHWEWL